MGLNGGIRRLSLGLAAVLLVVGVVVIVRAAGGGSAGESPLVATDLRTGSRTDPLGLDAAHPVLSWVPSAANGNGRLRGYQVQVADSAARLSTGHPLWDTGPVDAARAWSVRYAGPAPTSGKRYFWWVRLRDGDGALSAWSPPASWQAGLLDEIAWGTSSWIAANGPTAPGEVLLRRAFNVAATPVTRATLTVAGVGFNVPYVNGDRIGDAQLSPAWTDYSKRITYDTYDVTGQVRSGANLLGVALAGGWYHPNTPDAWNLQSMPYVDKEKLRLRLDIEHAGAAAETVLSDGSWQWATGEVTFTSNRGGEDIDHRRSVPGWATDPTAGRFQPVAAGVAPKGNPVLVAASTEPERLGAVVPATMRRTTDGYLFTLDRNVAGALTVRLTGSPGTSARIQVGEGLAGDRVDPAFNDLNSKVAAGDRWQRADLTVAGSAEETFSTSFTYFAGLYVSLSVTAGNLTAPPQLEVRPVHTDVASTGDFGSSDPRLNALHAAARLTYLNNLHGYPTDCPQRERLGYGADGAAVAAGALLNFDSAPLYAKWMADFADAQDSDGYLPFTVPAYPRDRSTVWWSPWWGDAVATIPLQLYHQRGDLDTLAGSYPVIRRYADYLIGRLTGDLWTTQLFPPDHESVDAADGPQFNTMAVYVAVTSAAEAARLLDKTTDADRYSARGAAIRTAFNEHWFNRVHHAYSRTTGYRRAPQSVLATALQVGLVPDGETGRVFAALRAEIAQPTANAAFADHLTTGQVATNYLFEAMADFNTPDLAYRLLTQASYPGVLPGVLEPGGTLHESIADDGDSHDHPMFGSYDAWFYRGLAGLRLEKLLSDGLVTIRPGPVTGMAWAQASVDTVRGTVSSRWERDGRRIRFTVTTPVGVDTVLQLPDGLGRTLSVDGNPIPYAGIPTIPLAPGTHVVLAS